MGWPNLPTEPEVRRYYQLELAWYLHMLLKPVLRYGLPDGRDMLIHHAASLTLIVISYGAWGGGGAGRRAGHGGVGQLRRPASHQRAAARGPPSVIDAWLCSLPTHPPLPARPPPHPAVTNLTRLGTVVLGTFAMSNPLLHLAKICNQLSLGPLKIGGFMIFALIFFLSRILLVPWAVLKVTWLDCR